MTFREKIVKLRKTHGLTQDELASAVGVSRQAVYKWESGQTYPEVAQLLELKVIFNISIDDLLDENFEIEVPEKKKKKRLTREQKEAIEARVDRELGLGEEFDEASSGGEDAEPMDEGIFTENEEEEEDGAEYMEEAEKNADSAPEVYPFFDDKEGDNADEEEAKIEAPVSNYSEELKAEEKLGEEEDAPISDEEESELKAEGEDADNSTKKKVGFFGRLFGKK